VSGTAAARHATGELASRDAKVLGDVLKIRFYPLAVDNAEGDIVTDVDGRRHLDSVVGGAVANTGHGAPEIVEPVISQMCSTSFGALWFGPNEAAVWLAGPSTDLTPSDSKNGPGSLCARVMGVPRAYCASSISALRRTRWRCAR
jgi:4-aminobutyrate aminotransferase-like enzyme